MTPESVIIEKIAEANKNEIPLYKRISYNHALVLLKLKELTEKNLNDDK